MRAAPVQCIDCVHFNLRANRDMAEQGYGRCNLEQRPGRFESAVFPRICPDFAAAPADVAANRRQWLAEQRENFRKSIIGETA